MKLWLYDEILACKNKDLEGRGRWVQADLDVECIPATMIKRGLVWGNDEHRFQLTNYEAESISKIEIMRRENND